MTKAEKKSNLIYDIIKVVAVCMILVMHCTGT